MFAIDVFSNKIFYISTNVYMHQYFYVEIKLTIKVALLVLICWHAIWYISLQLAIDNMNIVKGFQKKWLADWFNQSTLTYIGENGEGEIHKFLTYFHHAF